RLVARQRGRAGAGPPRGQPAPGPARPPPHPPPAAAADHTEQLGPMLLPAHPPADRMADGAAAAEQALALVDRPQRRRRGVVVLVPSRLPPVVQPVAELGGQEVRILERRAAHPAAGGLIADGEAE